MTFFFIQFEKKIVWLWAVLIKAKTYIGTVLVNLIRIFLVAPHMSTVFHLQVAGYFTIKQFYCLVLLRESVKIS